MKKLNFKLVIGIIWIVFFLIFIYGARQNLYNHGFLSNENLVYALVIVSIILIIIWNIYARKQEKASTVAKTVVQLKNTQRVDKDGKEKVPQWWIAIAVIGWKNSQMLAANYPNGIESVETYIMLIIPISVALYYLLYKKVFRSVKNNVLKIGLSFAIPFILMLLTMSFVAITADMIASQNKAFSMIQAANEEVRIGNIQGGINKYDQAATIDPNSAWVLGNAGRTIAFNDPEKALGYCNSTIEKEPKDALGYLCRGTANLALGLLNNTISDIDNAISDLNKSLLTEEDFLNVKSSSYSVRGMAKFFKEDYSGAIDDLNMAIKEDPNNVASKMMRGMAQIKLGQIKEGCNNLNNARKGATEIELSFIGEDGIKFIDETCNKE